MQVSSHLSGQRRAERRENQSESREFLRTDDRQREQFLSDVRQQTAVVGARAGRRPPAVRRGGVAPLVALVGRLVGHGEVDVIDGEGGDADAHREDSGEEQDEARKLEEERLERSAARGVTNSRTPHL